MPTATGAIAGGQEDRSTCGPPDTRHPTPCPRSSTNPPIQQSNNPPAARIEHPAPSIREPSIHQSTHPPIRRQAIRPNPTKSDRHFDPPRQPPESSIAHPVSTRRPWYTSAPGWVRAMVQVAPHKTPVVIGLVHWYGYFTRWAPPNPGPFSQPSTFNSQLPFN